MVLASSDGRKLVRRCSLNLATKSSTNIHWCPCDVFLIGRADGWSLKTKQNLKNLAYRSRSIKCRVDTRCPSSTITYIYPSTMNNSSSCFIGKMPVSQSSADISNPAAPPVHVQFYVILHTCGTFSFSPNKPLWKQKISNAVQECSSAMEPITSKNHSEPCKTIYQFRTVTTFQRLLQLSFLL